MIHGFPFLELLKLEPRRRHRVAHRMAHRWKPCEVCEIVEILRSQDVGDDEVVGEAGEGFFRLDKARVSISGRNITACASHGSMRRVGRHVKRVVCASLYVESSERALLSEMNEAGIFILTTVFLPLLLDSRHAFGSLSRSYCSVVP